jgi:hypothetical protein
MKPVCWAWWWAAYIPGVILAAQGWAATGCLIWLVYVVGKEIGPRLLPRQIARANWLWSKRKWRRVSVA